MFSAASVPSAAPTDAVALFPDDPRYRGNLHATSDHYKALSSNYFLRTDFVEWLIQQAFRATSTDHDTVDTSRNHCSPLSFYTTMESILRSVRSTKAADRKRVKSLMEKYAFLHEGKHTVVVPHCSRSHFVVVLFVFDLDNQPIFERVDCYDSLHPDGLKVLKKIKWLES